MGDPLDVEMATMRDHSIHGYVGADHDLVGSGVAADHVTVAGSFILPISNTLS